MELKEALLRRRSIRRFTAEPVSDEMIEELLHAAMSGPSACNRVPWEFYVITRPETLDALRHVTPFSNMNAPLAFVVAGCVSRALPRQASAFWVQDCSAATENILLRAVDLSLGGVWCGVHPTEQVEERVRAILEMPEDQIPLNIVYIGHPAESHKPGDQYNPDYVHYFR